MSVEVDLRALDAVSRRLRKGGYTEAADEVQRAITIIMAAADHFVSIVAPGHNSKACPRPRREGFVAIRRGKRFRLVEVVTEGQDEFHRALLEGERDGRFYRVLHVVREFWGATLQLPDGRCPFSQDGLVCYRPARHRGRHRLLSPQAVLRPPCEFRYVADRPACGRAATWRCAEHGWLCGMHSKNMLGRVCSRCGAACVDYWDYETHAIEPIGVRS